MDIENKIFFKPGDLVKVKHKLEYAPLEMVVIKVEKVHTVNNEHALAGVLCYWFNAKKEYMQNRFNTKDLEHIYKDK